MINSDTYFYCYISVILILLISLSILVSSQIKLFFVNIIIHFFMINRINSVLTCSEKTYLNLLSIYLSRSEYFMCVLLCESYLKNSSFFKNKKFFYIGLASSYAQTKYWDIAQYYYLEALVLLGEDREILYKLLLMYKYLGYKSRVNDIYSKIAKIDSDIKVS